MLLAGQILCPPSLWEPLPTGLRWKCQRGLLFPLDLWKYQAFCISKTLSFSVQQTCISRSSPYFSAFFVEDSCLSVWFFEEIQLRISPSQTISYKQHFPSPFIMCQTQHSVNSCWLSDSVFCCLSAHTSRHASPRWSKHRTKSSLLYPAQELDLCRHSGSLAGGCH